MTAHDQSWNLKECAKRSSEIWLKDCIGADFGLETYLSEAECGEEERKAEDRGYSMSLSQRCEYAWYLRVLKSLPDSERLRLLSNSGPTQTWVTALPLSWKNWNLSSREWLIAARRRLGLDVRTRRTRCSNCRYHEIGLKGDHALRCAGKMGSKMRHDAIAALLARAFKQAGFEVKKEQDGGLLDRRRPSDLEVENWVLITKCKESASLSIDWP